MSVLSAPTPVNAVANSAVATAKGAKELYDNRKEVYASAKDFAGKLTSKDDKVRDYAAGQAKAYTMSAVLGGAATKALGSRLPKPNVNVPGGGTGGKGNIFGKDILETQTRTGRDGKAVEIKFKDGSKIDINSARVKEWKPNEHPKAPEGALQKVKFEESLPGSKGYKRAPNQDEKNFLNNIFSK
ncbi:hypothetical protein I4Q48_19150 [Leptospira interrogans]|nr:hypothetical protein [Leptospira interrogans]